MPKYRFVNVFFSFLVNTYFIHWIAQWVHSFGLDQDPKLVDLDWCLIHLAQAWVRQPSPQKTTHP